MKTTETLYFDMNDLGDLFDLGKVKYFETTDYICADTSLKFRKDAIGMDSVLKAFNIPRKAYIRLYWLKNDEEKSMFFSPERDFIKYPIYEVKSDLEIPFLYDLPEDCWISVDNNGHGYRQTNYLYKRSETDPQGREPIDCVVLNENLLNVISAYVTFNFYERYHKDERYKEYMKNGYETITSDDVILVDDLGDVPFEPTSMRYIWVFHLMKDNYKWFSSYTKGMKATDLNYPRDNTDNRLPRIRLDILKGNMDMKKIG